MNDIKLGQIVTTPQSRDAIHLAVMPVIAGEPLRPGQLVCIVDGKAKSVFGQKPVGIVDPFLLTVVDKGETFWLCLSPDTITSLRHDWTHPAFETKAVNEKSKSEKWLRDFCARHEWMDYDNMISKLQINGDYAYQMGGDSAKDEGISAEFRRHFKIVTGSEVLGSIECSC